jgi:hypothetical protein
MLISRTELGLGMIAVVRKTDATTRAKYRVILADIESDRLPLVSMAETLTEAHQIVIGYASHNSPWDLLAA